VGSAAGAVRAGRHEHLLVRAVLLWVSRRRRVSWLPQAWRRRRGPALVDHTSFGTAASTTGAEVGWRRRRRPRGSTTSARFRISSIVLRAGQSSSGRSRSSAHRIFFELLVGCALRTRSTAPSTSGDDWFRCDFDARGASCGPRCHHVPGLYPEGRGDPGRRRAHWMAVLVFARVSRDDGVARAGH
jgi:hypothetical protein